MGSNINIIKELLNSFTIYKDKPFLTNEDCSISKTYDDFLSDATNLALNKFSKLKKDSKILILNSKKYDNFVSIFACLLSGNIAIPVDPTTTKKKLNELKKNYKPNLILKNGIKLSNKRKLKNNLKIEKKTFLIIQSSGTTGNSKGIVFSNTNYLKSAKYFQNLANYDQTSCLYHCLPLHFNAGILNLFFSIIFAGGKIVFSEKIDAIKILNFWKIPMRFNCDTLHLVPSIIENLNKISLIENKEKEYIKNIKSIYSTGSYLHENTQDRFFKKFKRRIQSVYGVTEIGGPITLQRWEDTFEENNIGHHEKEVKIKIIKHKNKPFIYIKTDFMMDGYYDLNKFSKIKLLKGYFKTDDIGYHKNNTLFFYGRDSENIKINGEMISLKYIENIAKNHKDILQVAVTTKKNELNDDLIYLFAQIKKVSDFKSNIESIYNYLKKKLKKIELPYKILLVPDLPKTASGKIKKNILNDIYD